MNRIPALFLFALCLLMAAPAHAESLRKQVLYLNSYQNGYEWSDSIHAGIRDTLRHSEYQVELQVEYMDAKKHPARENQAILKQLFAVKFANTRFDAIICSDNDAFQFMLENQQELFPEVPVVFCGVNALQKDLLKGRDNYTGVIEQLDIRKNLELALQFNPKKKRVIIIGDNSLTSEAIKAQIREAEPFLDSKLTFDFWEEMPLDLILEKTRNLPDDSFLFLIPFYIETEDSYLSASEIVQTVSGNTNVPVYSAWRFLLGQGIVGGKLLSGERQGMLAAQSVLKIFDGSRPADIAVTVDTEIPFAFDWNEIVRFDLTEGPFPAHATFINLPHPIYQLEKGVVWAVIGFMVILSIFTFTLAASRSRAIRAEKELALSRKMLRSVIDTMPQLIYWKDIKSRYLGVNKRFAEFFNLPSVEEAERKTNRDLLPSEHMAEFGERVDREVLQSNSPRMRETVYHTNDNGESVVFEVNKVPLHDDKGEVSGVLSTAEDITARIDLERQLIKSQKMEAIGTFVGGIAHDFNNLLTTIINSTELALLDIDNPDATEDVLRAKSAAEQGSQLVNQILSYTRPSNQRAVIIDPTETANEALDLIEAMLPDNILLAREINPGDIHGLADPSQLRQIIMNLCTNAFHAMRETGGVLTASLTLEHLDSNQAVLHGLAPGSHLRLVITDTGPGIPQDMQDRVFDLFYTTKGKGEGTGLGLAIVQGIVQGHRGAIRLSSRPGHTSFDILLPFSGEAARNTNVNGKDVEGTEHILFVEDSSEQLNVVPRALFRLGYTVTSARGGQAALDMLTAEGPFDMVVTDYDMPGLSGVELARTVKQLFPDMPIIVVSGSKEGAAAAEASADVAQIVFKPYTGPDLALAIRTRMDPETKETPRPKTDQ